MIFEIFHRANRIFGSWFSFVGSIASQKFASILSISLSLPLTSSIYFDFIVSIGNDWHFESVKITREAAMDTAKKNGIWKNRFNLDTLIEMTIETNKLLQLTTFFCVLSLYSDSARIYLFSCSNNCIWREGEEIFFFEFCVYPVRQSRHNKTYQQSLNSLIKHDKILFACEYIRIWWARRSHNDNRRLCWAKIHLNVYLL